MRTEQPFGPHEAVGDHSDNKPQASGKESDDNFTTYQHFDDGGDDMTQKARRILSKDSQGW